MPEPLASVVVPTRSRPARLAQLLDGLAQQTLGDESFEVVVVCDGASDETHRVLAGRPVHVVSFEQPRGPAGARNAGWREASGRYVAFIDDDCVPTENWLAAALRFASPNAFVQGAIAPDPSAPVPDGLLVHSYRKERLGPQFESGNILYPRAALESLGGFDERYGRTPGGEDTDLGWRAIGAGLTPVFAPDALVFHAVERLGLAGSLRYAARWTGTMRVFADHPQSRAMLYRGHFWNVWHYLMWRSLAALLGPRWFRQTMLTLHLIQLRKRCRVLGAGSWAIPFLIVHDLVECWAVARGALRYRAPVL